jgi:hypothetical protein
MSKSVPAFPRDRYPIQLGGCRVTASMRDAFVFCATQRGDSYTDAMREAIRLYVDAYGQGAKQPTRKSTQSV